MEAHRSGVRRRARRGLALRGCKAPHRRRARPGGASGAPQGADKPGTNGARNRQIRGRLAGTSGPPGRTAGYRHGFDIAVYGLSHELPSTSRARRRGPNGAFAAPQAGGLRTTRSTALRPSRSPISSSQGQAPDGGPWWTGSRSRLDSNDDSQSGRGRASCSEPKTTRATHDLNAAEQSSASPRSTPSRENPLRRSRSLRSRDSSRLRRSRFRGSRFASRLASLAAHHRGRPPVALASLEPRYPPSPI